MRQEGSIAGFFRLFFENLDKGLADYFPFFLRVFEALEAAQEQLAGVPMDEVDVEMIAKQLYHLPGFIKAKKTMVNKHACQLLANRLMQQNRHNG